MESIVEKVDSLATTTTTTIPSFDYLNDIDKIDEELKCPICMNPFLEPKIMKCCQSTLCYKCVKDCGKVCPLCKQNPLPLSKPPPIIMNMLSRIEVSCKTCSVVVKRDFFQEHILKACPIQCPNNCGESQSRESVEAHLEVCPRQPVSCGASLVGCSHFGQRVDIETHQSNCSLFSQKDILLKLKELEEKLITVTTQTSVLIVHHQKLENVLNAFLVMKPGFCKLCRKFFDVDDVNYSKNEELFQCFGSGKPREHQFLNGPNTCPGRLNSRESSGSSSNSSRLCPNGKKCSLCHFVYCRSSHVSTYPIPPNSPDSSDCLSKHVFIRSVEDIDFL
jgi:hypothetical protein